MSSSESAPAKGSSLNLNVVKRLVGLIIAALGIVLTMTCEPPDGLTREGFASIGVAIVIVALWVLEVVPPGVAGLFVIVLIPMLGITTLAESFSGFGCTMVFMIIASSALAVILIKSTIPTRAIMAALSWAKGSSKKFVFAFMVITALFSSVISNTPIALMFLGVAKVFLGIYGKQPGTTNLGRCLFIGICGSAMIGGMATPVGTAINLLGISALENALGISIGFAQWMIVGVPCAILTELAFFFGVVTFCKPEPIPEGVIEELREETKVEGKLDSYDWRVIIFIVALMILWVLGSFVSWLPNVTVAIAAVFIMFLPGVNMMNWKEYCDGIPWQVVCAFGAVNVFMGPFASTGAAQWIADLFMVATAGMSGIVLALLFSLFVVYLNAFFPLGTACVGMFAAPMALIAVNSGVISPVVTTFIVSLGSGCSFMIPFSLVYLLVYPESGYFDIKDCLKTGWLPTLLMAVILALVPFGLVSLFW